LAIFILLAILGSTFSILSENSGALEPPGPEDPEIILTLPTYPVKILTGPGETGITSIKAPLTIVKPLEAISDTVTLELWSIIEEEDLSISIEPEEVVFPPNGNRTKDFEVTFEFHYDPLHETSYIIGRFQIEGIWRYSTLPKNGRMITEGGEVEIVPFLLTEARSVGGTDRLEAEVGEWKDVIIDVTNNGNAQVTISVEVVEVPNDIGFYVNTPTLVINPFGNETAHLRVRQESGKGRETTIKVRFTTKHIDKRETDDVAISLETETKETSVVSSL